MSPLIPIVLVDIAEGTGNTKRTSPIVSDFVLKFVRTLLLFLLLGLLLLLLLLLPPVAWSTNLSNNSLL